ncbi:hypothetical protein ABEV54_19615 [Peribacillus psychrosaccharolyticus]|uniref:hypothetical protein n=1 Tax=Peribacillus psychrosaccharolyticus TaxID=1407 RepID=UPI003D26DAE2
MDIRTYYNQIAKMCFYAAWTCTGLAFLFFILKVMKVLDTNVFFITGPFILLSIFHFIGYRIYENRLINFPEMVVQKNSNLFKEENLLVTFLPAPTLRMLLFAPNGKLVGEVRDQNMKWYLWLIPSVLSIILPKKYGLYGTDGELVAEYNLRGGIKQGVTMIVNGEVIGCFRQTYKESLFSFKGEIRGQNGSEWMTVNPNNFFTNFEIKNQAGANLVTFQKGWMPREWSTIFKELNTPILTFHSSAKINDKIVVLGYVASVYNHRSN